MIRQTQWAALALMALACAPYVRYAQEAESHVARAVAEEKITRDLARVQALYDCRQSALSVLKASDEAHTAATPSARATAHSAYGRMVTLCETPPQPSGANPALCCAQCRDASRRDPAGRSLDGVLCASYASVSEACKQTFNLQGTTVKDCEGQP